MQALGRPRRSRSPSLGVRGASGRLTRPNSKSPRGQVAPSTIAAGDAVVALTGTYTARHGGQASFIDGCRLVQLAAYPEYDGKRDQHRERHSDAGAHVPEHNEFPDCHGNERLSSDCYWHREHYHARARRQRPKELHEKAEKSSASPGSTKPSTAAAG